MKKLNFTLIILLSLSFVISGCKKDENNTEVTITLQNQVGQILSYRNVYVFDNELSGAEAANPAFADTYRQTDNYGIAYFGISDIYDVGAWDGSKVLYFKFISKDLNDDYYVAGEIDISVAKGDIINKIILLE